jgi:DNA polymerase-3 subunit alpha
MIYIQVVDSIAQDKKNNMAGQMTLFDLVGEDDKKDFEIKVPNVDEFTKLELLAFEKEVIGVYVSGHPLEEYMTKWKKRVNAISSDFSNDDDDMKVREGQNVTIGGIVTAVTMKTTKTNKVMAFINIEDIYGTVEVIVFPKDYEKYRFILYEDNKVFITGRVSANDEGDGKVIAENIAEFDQIPQELWIRFEDKEAFQTEEKELYEILADSDGKDVVVIYLNKEKAKKILPSSYSVNADFLLVDKLSSKFGKENVAIR